MLRASAALKLICVEVRMWRMPGSAPLRFFEVVLLTFVQVCMLRTPMQRAKVEVVEVACCVRQCGALTHLC